MKQITVSQFLKLPILEQIEYTSVLQHLKGKPIYNINISELSYNDVKMCFNEMQKDTANEILIFTTALKISESDFLKIPIQKYFVLKKYIENFFISLKKNEVILLQSISVDEGLWDLAGGKTLNEFADILPLSQLARLYGGYPFDYADRSYAEIIYLLRMNNKQGQVEAEYQRLKSNKNK